MASDHRELERPQRLWRPRDGRRDERPEPNSGERENFPPCNPLESLKTEKSSRSALEAARRSR